MISLICGIYKTKQINKTETDSKIQRQTGGCQQGMG